MGGIPVAGVLFSVPWAVRGPARGEGAASGPAWGGMRPRQLVRGGGAVPSIALGLSAGWSPRSPGSP